ncbi:alpha-L-fucosidase [Persicirhabdus sediminis]|uniref:alpha-L-fucosidase n=1 Tax=Persicirhabdus sediminis TaxID=454144 RepID=A0A8J7MCM9_9BACT|nr:alpha-L-fucosidase [Persicirhabdus sediminis]MBK1791229.1 alpha-L-fucosidase [Persicirhabdus sediminis]
MKVSTLLSSSVCLAASIALASAQSTKFKPTWESVGVKNDAPEWLKDAKFGIYTHWGPQTFLGTLPVTGSIGYYNNMYVKDSPVYKYHVENYGSPSEVGYKDMVDYFKAKDFDSEKWAQTFYDSGARFAGMVVIHHDNFCMYNSDINPVNAKQKGPKRDITGELAASYRKRGMNFITTFHNMASWGHSFLGSYDYDGSDPKYVGMYNEPHKKSDPCTREYLDRQLGLVKEVIDKYEPDSIWFDYGLYNALKEDDRLDLASYYYNWAEDHNKDVTFIHKHGTKLPTGMLNTERGRPGNMMEKTFMNDESIGVRYWFLNKERYDDAGNFPGEYLTHTLIDLVSKNGTFLLNIAPDLDGNIPADQLEVLNIMGSWLDRYGEAIYKTRPWENYGEGPHQVRFQGKISGSEEAMRQYSNSDIRFTKSKDGKTVYAIYLGQVSADTPIRSMFVDKPELLKGAKLVGGGAVKMTVNKDKHPVLDISNIPVDNINAVGVAIAIPAEAISYNPKATEVKFKQVSLSVDTASIHGDSIQLVTIDADDSIRALEPWTNKEDSFSWEVEIPAAGTWVVEPTILAKSPTSVTVTLAGETKTTQLNIKRVKSKPGKSDFGSFKIDKPGTYTLKVASDSSNPKWKPFHTYGMKIKQVE